MTDEELDYEIAKAERMAFISLSDFERDWLIYKKLEELEDYLFEIREKFEVLDMGER